MLQRPSLPSPKTLLAPPLVVTDATDVAPAVAREVGERGGGEKLSGERDVVKNER